MTVPLHLTYGGVRIDLPSDLHWIDEYAGQRVAQSLRYSITGAQLREETARRGGRPITLAGEADAAWMARSDLDTLRAWSDIPGATMALRLRGQDYAVMWDHGSRPIEAEPVVIYDEPLPGDPCIVTLRLLTVPST